MFSPGRGWWLTLPPAARGSKAAPSAAFSHRTANKPTRHSYWDGLCRPDRLERFRLRVAITNDVSRGADRWSRNGAKNGGSIRNGAEAQPSRVVAGAGGRGWLVASHL